MLTNRRSFLKGLASGGALVATGGLGMATRILAQAKDPAKLLVRSSRPHDLETEVAAFAEDFTENASFFVRSHHGAPLVQTDHWRLTVRAGEEALSFTLAELEKLDPVTLPVVLQCSGNGRAFFNPTVPGVPWEKGAVGQARWTGVRLRDLLERAGVKSSDARHVHVHALDRPALPTVPSFARSIPLERALDETTLVAYAMNGEPLPVLHGAPVRLVVPGWAGDHWVKWVRGLSVEKEEADGFYMKTAYRLPRGGGGSEPLSWLNVKSLIVRPSATAALHPGSQEVSGVAWTGRGHVKEVAVSLDGGRSWADARLDPPRTLGAWQRFRLSWNPAPGKYRILARAKDSSGAVQPAAASWNPGGYLWNGQDVLDCEVRA